MDRHGAYARLIGTDPIDGQMEALLRAAYPDDGMLRDFVLYVEESAPWIGRAIRRRASEGQTAFMQSSILAVYAAVRSDHFAAAEAWPLTLDELAPVFSDMGISMEWRR